MYERILLAVDGSHASELALYQAILVSKVSGAEVEALFVVDSTDAFFTPSATTRAAPKRASGNTAGRPWHTPQPNWKARACAIPPS